MVVLRPVLEGERVRICSKCNCLGLESPIRERSTYRRVLQRYFPCCRRCESRATRARQLANPNPEHTRRLHLEAEARRRAAREADPELAAAYRARRAAMERRAREGDPETWKRRSREGNRRHRKKIAADPVLAEQARQNRHIDYLVKREREGKPLPEPPVRFMGGPALEPRAVGPFRCWLNQLVAAEARFCAGAMHDVSLLGPEARTAARTRISQRRLWAYRYGPQLVIDSDVIDRAVTNEGSVRPEDIYCDTGVFHGPEPRP